MEGIVARSSEFSGKQERAMKRTWDGETKDPSFSPALSPKTLHKVNKLFIKGNS